MKRFAFVLCMLLIGQPALADGDARSPVVEVSNLLPPPPAAGSAAAQHDLDAVLAAQASRTPQDMAAAKADTERSVFRFDDALGGSLQASALPKMEAFFERVAELDKASAKDAKLYWKRPRPAVMSDQVHPLSKEKPDDWSYPSGHATFGYTVAVLLSNMVPEQRVAIFARADLYAQHRVVMGAHFPSDLEAGKLAGTVIAAQILHDPRWQGDYNAARGELRHALGLSAVPGAKPMVAAPMQ